VPSFKNYYNSDLARSFQNDLIITTKIGRRGLAYFGCCAVYGAPYRTRSIPLVINFNS